MYVRALARPFTVIAKSNETLIDIANRMRFNDVGSAVVLDDSGEVAGIITERDLVHAIADGADLDVTTASGYMTSDPIVVAPEVECVVAATHMARQGIAHLPVVDGSRLAGVISQRDLVAELLTERVSH
jgi:CBS domain-containing protein